MARPSSILGVTIVTLVKGLPSCILVPCPVFFLLTCELLDDAVGGAGRGEKQNASEILVDLYPSLLSNDIERRVGIGKGR